MRSALCSIFCVVLTFLAVNLKAQAPDGWGIRGGFHRAGQFLEGEKQYGNLNTFHVGVFHNRRFGESILSLYAETAYHQVGFKDGSDNMQNFRKIHQLAGVLALRADFGPIFLILGPALYAKLGEKFELAGVDILDSDTEYRSLDIPVVASVGVQLGAFSIDARYSYSFTKDQNDYRSAFLQLGAGFAF